MLSNYDIVLFDSDNTLYDHDIHEHSALYEAFEKYGMRISEEMYLLYKKINNDIWKEFECGIVHEDGPLVERFRRFSKASGIELSPTRINELYVEALSNQCSPFPDAFEVCRSLSKTHKLYIITNGTESIQLKRYEASPLHRFFSGIFTAASIGIQKPRSEYFERVLDRIGKPEKCRVIIVGDSLTSDILGGINSGIDTCWYNPHSHAGTRDISPKYEIRKLTELI